MNNYDDMTIAKQNRRNLQDANRNRYIVDNPVKLIDRRPNRKAEQRKLALLTKAARKGKFAFLEMA